MLVSANRFLAFLGWGRLPGKGPAHPTAAFPGKPEGADPGGVRSAHRRGQGGGPGTAAAIDGDHLLHGHPGKRGEVYHRGGAAVRQGGDRPEGQDPHHPAPRQAVPEAAEVLQKKKHRLRRGVPHQKTVPACPRKQIWAEMKSLCGLAGVGALQGVPPTTCGTCSPGPFSRPAGTWPSWRTCWATALWRPPASTSSPPGRNTPRTLEQLRLVS